MNNKSTNIIVTGANGFTGRFVCKELLKRKIKFSVVLRPGKSYPWIQRLKINTFYADVNNTSSLSEVFKGFNCLINIVSLGFGSAEKIVESCENAGIKRGIFVSSTSIFTTLNPRSKKIRIMAETIIKESNLVWTIIRPTMIYGTPKDRNIIKLIKWIKSLPILPIFGNGQSLQQPIHVKDVANALLDVIFNEKTFYKSYNISGKNFLTYNEVIDIICFKINKKVIKLFLPYKICAKILQKIERLNIKLPIKSEQILRLNEDKSFSHINAFNDFGFNPIPFEEGIVEEIKLFEKIV